MKRFPKPALLVVALALVLTACTGQRALNESAPQPKEVGSVRGGDTSAESRGAAPAAAPADQAAQGSSSTQQLPPIPPGTPGNLAGQKVIKNADIHIEVGSGKFQDRFSQANQVADRFGGFVSSTSTTETKGRVASGSVTIRVPSDKFQAALVALRKLGRVAEENQSGEDVSQEFVDLEARLRSAKAQEAFYLKLLDKATTISDSIQIAGQLSQVQLQIEQIQGRLNYLNDQTSMSTVTIRLFEPGVERSAAKGLLGRAWANAVNGFQSVIAGVIVLLGWLAPLVILALLGLLIWKILRRRTTAEAPGTGQSG
jgi:hypothetical protein